MRAAARIFALLALFASEVKALDFLGFNDAAQDGEGLVWTLGLADLSGQHTNGLFSTDGSAWRMVSCPGTSDYTHGMWLTKLRGGDVLCVWSSQNAQGDARLLLSRHRGEVSRLFSTIDLMPKSADKWSGSAPVFEDARGQLWIFHGSRLWRVAADGNAEMVRQFTEKDLNRPLQEDDSGVSRIELIEDGFGQVWVVGTSAWDESCTLRHPYVFDGEKWRAQSDMRGWPGGMVVSIATRDHDHIWCARLAGGLYEIDVRTFAAVAIKEPQPGAFRHIQSTRAIGDAMYVATQDGNEYEYDPPRALQRTSALWRFQNGTWQRVIAGFADDFAMLKMGARIGDDTLIPRSGGGFWKLTRESDLATLIDWRRGVHLAEISRIFPHTDGKLLLMAFTPQRGGSDFLQFLDPGATAHPLPSHLDTFRLRVPMIQDAAGALWQIPLDAPGRLRHHDGTAWRDIALPKSISTEHVARLAPDSRNRLWLLPDDTTQTAALFDPREKKWEVFKSLELAYQSHLPRRADFRVEADWLSPRYSKDGRIAFSHPRERLHYFDAKAWSSADNLVTAQKPFRAEICPFFNRAGRLAFNYHGYGGMITQEFMGKKGWQQGEYEDNANDPSWKDEKKPPLPRGAVSDKPESFTQDRLGCTWLVAGHRLYRALPGVCVPVLAENEANPFADGRSVDRAFVTGDGEILLLTDQYYRGEYLHLRFETPLPETQARVAAASADTADLAVESDAAPPRWFRWRLNDGAWSDPVSGPRIKLDALPAGEHRCEVAALDRWLRADLTPAVIFLKIEISESERLAGLIAQLGDADFEKREAAVRMLARFSHSALPLLRAARETASQETQWWLDAAIQEAQRGSADASK